MWNFDKHSEWSLMQHAIKFCLWNKNSEGKFVGEKSPATQTGLKSLSFAFCWYFLSFEKNIEKCLETCLYNYWSRRFSSRQKFSQGIFLSFNFYFSFFELSKSLHFFWRLDGRCPSFASLCGIQFTRIFSEFAFVESTWLNQLLEEDLCKAPDFSFLPDRFLTTSLLETRIWFNN